ncbi:hypothetical protein FDP41_002308 [Naegleria fowleri]|uniref:Uncharacterized protein n=1 Tax=Naegleria fowleri TaxID=5763 RepID=A0A6A5BXJ4_NAEFO|nr:uncharacterized protein FDP41_002308 [Naegleria fowleri]KAF0978488.1 hypothetical protein FDP41_002308 [Naegleria fowleri]CAG4718485.1 unnamed protein product [Naegleria fowleri]
MSQQQSTKKPKLSVLSLSAGNNYFGDQIGHQLYEDYLPSIMAAQSNCAQYFDVELDKNSGSPSDDRKVVSEREYAEQLTSCLAESLCPRTFLKQSHGCVSKLIRMNAEWTPKIDKNTENDFKNDLKECFSDVKECVAEFILHGSLNENK